MEAITDDEKYLVELRKYSLKCIELGNVNIEVKIKEADKLFNWLFRGEQSKNI